MIDSYNTIGTTIIHLPEISHLIKYVLQILNEKMYPILDDQVCRKVIICISDNFILAKYFQRLICLIKV